MTGPPPLQVIAYSSGDHHSAAGLASLHAAHMATCAAARRCLRRPNRPHRTIATSSAARSVSTFLISGAPSTRSSTLQVSVDGTGKVQARLDQAPGAADLSRLRLSRRRPRTRLEQPRNVAPVPGPAGHLIYPSVYVGPTLDEWLTIY